MTDSQAPQVPVTRVPLRSTGGTLKLSAGEPLLVRKVRPVYAKSGDVDSPHQHVKFLSHFMRASVCYVAI